MSNRHESQNIYLAFISYNREFENDAVTLNDTLTSLYKEDDVSAEIDAISSGGGIWFDKEKIETGEKWKREIFYGLEGTMNLIFLITESSLKSKWCHRELGFARENGKYIIPLTLQSEIDSEEIQRFWRSENWTDEEIQQAEDNLQYSLNTQYKLLDSWSQFDRKKNYYETNLWKDLKENYHEKIVHTIFLHHAIAWDKAGRKTDHLIQPRERFEELKKTSNYDKWQEIEDNEAKNHYPRRTKLIDDFLAANTQHHETQKEFEVAQKEHRQTKRLLNTIIFVFITVLVLMLLREVRRAAYNSSAELLASAMVSLEQRDFTKAEEYIRNALEVPNLGRPPDELDRAVRDLLFLAGRSTVVEQTQGMNMTHMAASSNGQTLVTGGPGQIQIWTPQTETFESRNEQTFNLGNNSRLLDLAVNSRGTAIAAVLGNGTVRVWVNGAEFTCSAEAASAITFDDRGDHFFVGTDTGTIIEYFEYTADGCSEQNVMNRTSPHTDKIVDVIFNDGKLISAGDDETIHIFDVTNDLHPVGNSISVDGLVHTISIAHDPDQLLVALFSENMHTIQQYDLTTGSLEATFPRVHQDDITSVFPLGEQSLIVSSSQDGQIILWDGMHILERGRFGRLRTSLTSTERFPAVPLRSDDAIYRLGQADGVTLWELDAPGVLDYETDPVNGFVNHVASVPVGGGHYVFVASSEELTVWGIQGDTIIQNPCSISSIANIVQMHVQDNYLYIAQQNGKISKFSISNDSCETEDEFYLDQSLTTVSMASNSESLYINDHRGQQHEFTWTPTGTSSSETRLNVENSTLATFLQDDGTLVKVFTDGTIVASNESMENPKHSSIETDVTITNVSMNEQRTILLAVDTNQRLYLLESGVDYEFRELTHFDQTINSTSGIDIASSTETGDYQLISIDENGRAKLYYYTEGQIREKYQFEIDDVLRDVTFVDDNGRNALVIGNNNIFLLDTRFTCQLVKEELQGVECP